MTREDLRVVTGIAVSTIQRLEHAESDPRLTSLVALAFALRVPLDALVADLPPHSLSNRERRDLATCRHSIPSDPERK